MLKAIYILYIDNIRWQTIPHIDNSLAKTVFPYNDSTPCFEDDPGCYFPLYEITFFYLQCLYHLIFYRPQLYQLQPAVL